jgi:hypothetical protein
VIAAWHAEVAKQVLREKCAARLRAAGGGTGTATVPSGCVTGP